MTLRIPGLAFVLALALPIVANADGVTLGINTPSMIDTAWGSSGFVSFNDQSITTKALDTKRRLLIAGQSGSGSLVRRLLVNGQPDTSFGNNGSLAISLGSSTLKDKPAVFVPMADGSFYLLINHDLDTTLLGAPRNHSLVQVSASGSIVGANNGVRFTQDGFGIDIIRDAEGRFYLLSTTGFSDPGTGKMEWTLQRLRSDGSLDTSFSNDGAIHWSSNYASVINMFVGEHIQARYFDPDNTCQVRALFIGENGETNELCGEHANGRPLRLLSVPTLMPDVTEGVAYLGNTSPLPESGTFVANEGINIQTHPFGFFQIMEPTQINFITYTPSLQSTFWNFDSAALIAMSTNAIATMAHADADGGLYISFNKYDGGADGYYFYSPPATVFRSTGFTLDTLPDSLGRPTIGTSGGNYISSWLTVSGLGESVSVPARVTGGEISLNDTDWHKGWAWVHNGSKVRVRYPSSALLSIGGIIAPNSPSTPVGNVQSVSFRNNIATVDKPTPPPSEAGAGGSGGGSTDIFLLIAGLIALIKTAAGRKKAVLDTSK